MRYETWADLDPVRACHSNRSYVTFLPSKLFTVFRLTMALSKPALRKDRNVYLIGNYCPVIEGSKLPSKKQVLRVLFFNLREVSLDLRNSAHLVVQEVKVFWDKARIPVQDDARCVKKVEELYKQCRVLQKNFHRRSDTNIQRENDFIGELNDLFDIAHGDALSKIRIPEDREFLINQRKKGRVGFMYGIDTMLEKQEKRKAERQQRERERAERHAAEMANICKLIFKISIYF